MVAERPQFIVVVRYVVMVPPQTVFGTGKTVVFESGAKVYLCDVRSKAAQILCTVQAPGRGLWVKGEQIAGWLGDAFYLRLKVENEGGQEVPQPFYRVHIAGGCEPAEFLPSEVKPLVNWNSQQYLFLETSEKLVADTAIMILGDEGADYSNRFSYSVGRSREWKPVFSVARDSGELKPL